MSKMPSAIKRSVNATMQTVQGGSRFCAVSWHATLCAANAPAIPAPHGSMNDIVWCPACCERREVPDAVVIVVKFSVTADDNGLLPVLPANAFAATSSSAAWCKLRVGSARWQSANAKAASRRIGFHRATLSCYKKKSVWRAEIVRRYARTAGWDGAYKT